MRNIKLKIGFFTILLSFGVLVGCTDTPNTSNDNISENNVENSVENNYSNTEDSIDLSEEKSESDKTQDKNEEAMNKAEIENNEKPNSTNKEDGLVKAKSEYLQRMKVIEEQVEELNKKYKTEEGFTQYGMNVISSDQAKLYDDELNQIYGYLKENLGKEKFKELEKSEVDWIKKKEDRIAEIKKEFEGGSMAPLMVNSTIAKESKERCYYLINNYMK